MGNGSESDPFPARDATSAQIRTFFAQFLLTKMVSIEDAKASEIASRWPHDATGTQFWTFSLQTYRDIFGKAYGVLLWSRVHGVTEDDGKVFSQSMKKESTAIEKSIFVCLFLSQALFTGWIASYQFSLFSAASLSCAFYSAFTCWLWFYFRVPSRRERAEMEAVRKAMKR